MLFASGELVWPSFVGIYALDLTSGHTRTVPHCGTAIGDVALDGGYAYMLADHALLCRASLTTGTQSVQMLVATPNVIIDGFAVSSAAFAYAMHRRGDQTELRVAEWSNGNWRTFLTTMTVEHIAVASTATR